MAWFLSLAQELPLAIGAAKKKKKKSTVLVVTQQVINPTSIHEDAGSVPGLAR